MVATLIIDSDRVRGEFPMFDVRSVDEKSAVLSGPLFLEVGELLKLRFDAGKDQLEVEARVHSVAPGDESMTVHFLKPDPRFKGMQAGR